MGHDHSHETQQRNPMIEELAFNELSARYGRLFGDLTRADTRVQVLQRTTEALRERVQEYEEVLREHDLLDEEGNLLVPAEPVESDE